MAFHLLHMIKAGVGRLRRPAFDARAAVELTRFGLPFFPATRYALAPSALLTVLNDVIVNKRRTILELGSGYSSIYIAKALESAAPDGGVVITVDAHAGWLDQVVEKARAAGVADRVRAVHAPLAPIPGDADGAYWYDMAPIIEALAGASIDLMLVDGPVASGKAVAYARAPAVPMLKDRLSADCAVYLDDIHRPSHAEIAKQWSETLGLAFEHHHARGGFAYAARGESFDPII
ncbi:MAG: class I SAM-dependent methyltransferase [Pseudomonadota bacterium]